MSARPFRPRHGVAVANGGATTYDLVYPVTLVAESAGTYAASVVVDPPGAAYGAAFAAGCRPCLTTADGAPIEAIAVLDNEGIGVLIATLANLDAGVHLLWLRVYDGAPFVPGVVPAHTTLTTCLIRDEASFSDVSDANAHPRGARRAVAGTTGALGLRTARRDCPARAVVSTSGGATASDPRWVARGAHPAGSRAGGLSGDGGHPQVWLVVLVEAGETAGDVRVATFYESGDPDRVARRYLVPASP